MKVFWREKPETKKKNKGKYEETSTQLEISALIMQSNLLFHNVYQMIKNLQLPRHRLTHFNFPNGSQLYHEAKNYSHWDNHRKIRENYRHFIQHKEII